MIAEKRVEFHCRTRLISERGDFKRKNGVDFEAHAAGISRQRGSWLACRREVLLNSGSILPKPHKIERYTLYPTVGFKSFVRDFTIVLVRTKSLKHFK